MNRSANGDMIDKEDGYMNCPGDGAQPEFEVALFRYRDGRPLVALCSGGVAIRITARRPDDIGALRKD